MQIGGILMSSLREVFRTLPRFDLMYDETERRQVYERMTPDQRRVLEIAQQCAGDRELLLRLLDSEGLQ